MIPSDLNFDEIMKDQIERNFPVQVIIDLDRARGLFKFTSAFPPFEGTLIHYKRAFFNEEDASLSIEYEIIENPKALHPQDSNVQGIMTKIVSFMFQLETKLLFNRSH